MMTRLTQMLVDARITWPGYHSPFDILSIKPPEDDILLNFSLPDFGRLDVFRPGEGASVRKSSEDL